LLRRIRMRHIKHASHVQQIHSTPYLVVRSSAAAPAGKVGKSRSLKQKTLGILQANLPSSQLAMKRHEDQLS
jgi:hypothetical protein